MTLAAKIMPPARGGPEHERDEFAAAARGGAVVLEAPSGYLLTEGLIAALGARTGELLWARLGPEDSDPATLALLLVEATRRIDPGFGESVLALMRRHPGPVRGWEPIYRALGEELGGLLGGGAVVLENAHVLAGASPALGLVNRCLIPVLGREVAVVLLTRDRLAAAPAAGYAAYRTPKDLRLSRAVVEQWMDATLPGLPAAVRHRVRRMAGGRAAVLEAVRALFDRLGGGRAAQRLGRSGRAPLTVLGEALLEEYDGPSLAALGRAGLVGYVPPELPAPGGPWLQPLEGGWNRVRGCWRRVLVSGRAGARARPGPAAVRECADWLLRHGGLEQAVDLHLNLGEHEAAARLVAGQAGDLVGLGRWRTLDAWLTRLPEEVVAAYPELSYGRAEIAAARGQDQVARRSFAVAAGAFGRAGDPGSACRCVMGESVLAAQRGDLREAAARAAVACALAEDAPAGEARSSLTFWSFWHRGMLALRAGDQETALADFRHALSRRPEDSGVPAAVLGESARLVEQAYELRLRRQAHSVALAALEQEERRTLDQVLRLVTDFPRRLHEPGPWVRLPPPARMAGGAAPARRWLTRRSARPAHPPRPAAEPVPGPPPAAPPLAIPSPAAPSSAEPSPIALAPAGPAPADAPRLAIHLLGPLCVSVDDREVTGWPAGRCRSLLAYLVTHRDPWPRREQLMDLFWPKAEPGPARNNLNVTIHSVRRVLRTKTETPVIVLADGAYRFHAGMRLWVDIDVFDAEVERGRHLQNGGNPDEALRSFERAVGLYRGEFLADVPYEDWLVVLRERLRLAHLEALERLSGLHVLFGHHAAGAELCRDIIDLDPCREDAHRRLMTCYSRQGLQHLALIQYQACVRVLDEELGVGPTPETIELYERIRRREDV
ncbi:BTAD domain-containing putative transcriptional regulator [Nonomuraea sp. NPDC048892]|uniref:BTAD domain-containing putative transcriptional regulator n=1 Tax=Nonomuraea sp. NPDC048892 TaxID=3154624 RepID=UPI00340ABF9B